MDNNNNNRIQELDRILTKQKKDNMIYYPYFFKFVFKYQKFSDYFYKRQFLVKKINI